VPARWRRIGWLIFLGYTMHFPAEALSSDPARAQTSLHLFMMADVLQCIGVSIGIVQLMAMFAKKARTVVIGAGVLAVVFVAMAPLADAVPYDHWGRPLANYLTHRGGSLFPLFPWSGFVMAGVSLTFLVAPQGAKTDPWVPVPRLLGLAVLLFGVHALAKASPWTFVTDATTSHSVPHFAILKLAAVVGVVVVLSLIGTRVRSLPQWLQTLAGESLMLYWFHLMVLYGAGLGLASVVGRTLPLSEALLAAAAVVVVTTLVGLGWHRAKRWKNDVRARRAIP
jgi:hypothetical protein